MANKQTLKKIAIISGGTKGLGKELSLTFGLSGFYIFALYNSDDSTAKDLTRAFKVHRILGEIKKVDVSKFDKNIINFEKCSDLVIINNAVSSFQPRSFHTTPIDEFLRQWEVTVKSSILITKSFVKQLVKTKGTVINILSEGIISTPEGMSAYLSGKFALVGLGRMIANEYHKKGLKVLQFAPDVMDTALFNNFNTAVKTTLVNAKGSPTNPSDIANWILSIYSDPSKAGIGEIYQYPSEVGKRMNFVDLL